MTAPLSTFKPKLTASTRVRVRSDGSAGVYDDVTGRSLEVAKDQATLVELIDGVRTVPEIVEAHYAAHKYVPFSALDDLLRSLQANELLDPAGGKLDAAPRKKHWMSRLYTEVFHPRIPGAAILSVLVTLGAIAAAIVLKPEVAPVLTPWDVLLAYAGAAGALSLRRFFQGASLFAFGERVTHFELSLTAGILSFGPDPDALVLLDRPRRARVHMFGLVGATVAWVLGRHLSPGLAFGASAVLLCDLCPFAPTSFGKLLATLAGKVDLREHARAYLDRRILRRVVSTSSFEGEGSLVLSALLSLGWLGLIVRLLLTRGLVGFVSLLAEAVDAEGLERVLAYGGAVVLALLMPISVVALVAVVVRAFLSLRPPQSSTPGAKVTEGSGPVTALNQIPLFSRLSAAELKAITDAGETLRYAPGLAIVMQGEPGDRFFAILSGSVSVEFEQDSGLIRQVAKLRAGDCFGEMALLEGGARTATVRSAEETLLLALSRTAFDKVRATLKDDQVSAVLRASSALKKSTFFGSLPPERLSSLALKLHPRAVHAGDIVIKEGDTGDAFFLVGDGALEVLNKDGETIASLGPGDHFGEVALLRAVPRTATVRAKSPSLVLELDKQSFLSAMAADLSLSTRLEAFAAERVEAPR